MNGKAKVILHFSEEHVDGTLDAQAVTEIGLSERTPGLLGGETHFDDAINSLVRRVLCNVCGVDFTL